MKLLCGNQDLAPEALRHAGDLPENIASLITHHGLHQGISAPDRRR